MVALVSVAVLANSGEPNYGNRTAGTRGGYSAGAIFVIALGIAVPVSVFITGVLTFASRVHGVAGKYQAKEQTHEANG